MRDDDTAEDRMGRVVLVGIAAVAIAAAVIVFVFGRLFRWW